jgi:GT2 family glycosyltransferase/SAM-dependent methyltransferase/glycosyltransferase involved in cell wall biosynthesis
MTAISAPSQRDERLFHGHLLRDEEPLAHITYERLGIDPAKFYAGKFISPEVMLTDPAARFSADFSRARFLARNIRGGRVLDLGCGSGPYGRMLKEQCGVAELVGVDLDPACTALAARSYDEAQAICLEDRLPFADESFDAVFSVDFFGHVEFRHKNRLIAEIARVTRPGGLSLHAIESGEIDYLHADVSNLDDPVMRYVRQEGHVGIESGTAIRRRWLRCFAEVDVEIAYLYPIMPIVAMINMNGKWPEILAALNIAIEPLPEEFIALLRQFNRQERRAADACLGFVGDYLKDAVRRIDPELLAPRAETELHGDETAAESFMWRMFYTGGGLVYLPARKSGAAPPLRPTLPLRTPLYCATPTQKTAQGGRVKRVLRKASYWLLDASPDERRRRMRRLAAELGDKVRPRNLYVRLIQKARRWRERTRLRYEARAARRAIAADDDAPRGYDVICLPVMPWNTRVQRPQQLMRQFAAHGHRVFYAALGFCDGAAARLAAAERGVLEMTLPGTPGANVYAQLPTTEETQRMATAIDRLRKELGIASAVVVVQLPYWTALAETLRDKFGWPMIYDCMDDHEGFSSNGREMLEAERRTIASADLVVVTAEKLREKVEGQARRTLLVRNACDFAHFAGDIADESMGKGATAGLSDSAKNKGGQATRGTHALDNEITKTPTLGFYGAIAEWFDSDLVADLAEMRPGWRFELIGSTHTGDVGRLEKMPNVKLLGEQPYAELPRLTAGWDCNIIPFKRLPLTEATNPVKAYEMLATGKPLVAVDLPELRPMAVAGLLRVADDARGFAAAIEAELSAADPDARRRRREFASANTWLHRWQDLDAAARGLYPKASIAVVTFNNLALNQACLQSIFDRTDYPNYEVIVVDNASRDGTAEWLLQMEEQRRQSRGPRLKVILNAENRGFAAANNQALRIAAGEYLCLLNNDTLVARGWLSTLVGHMRRTPRLGLVGPVSNNVGNEAKVAVGYRDAAKMPAWAEDYCRRHDGQTVPSEMLGFFCVIMSREVYQRVGELDERFGLGCFEDDDYCRRVRAAGYELRFARDAFVHHWQEASFRLLGLDAYLRQYHKNQRKYEEKWK